VPKGEDTYSAIMNYIAPVGHNINEWEHLVLYEPTSFGFKFNCALQNGVNLVANFNKRYSKHNFEDNISHHMKNLLSERHSVAGCSYEALLELVIVQYQFDLNPLILRAKNDSLTSNTARPEWIENHGYSTTTDPVVSLKDLNTCQCSDKSFKHSYNWMFSLNKGQTQSHGYDFMSVFQTHEAGKVTECDIQLFQVTINPRKHKKGTMRKMLKKLKQTFREYSVTPYWIAPPREDGKHITPRTNLYWDKKDRPNRIVPRTLIWYPRHLMKPEAEIPIWIKSSLFS
jgi:hypothetical protein